MSDNFGEKSLVKGTLFSKLNEILVLFLTIL